MTRKAKTCFIYVRVSTKMQVENGESIEAQLYDLRQYAKRENLRILHEYIDAPDIIGLKQNPTKRASL